LLAALALRVQNDPFGKVKKMIKDMVIKLTEEATEEAEHKGFCDTELTTNKQTRDAKTTSVHTSRRCLYIGHHRCKVCSK
jgi:hypothetical protein